MREGFGHQEIPEFGREVFGSGHVFSRIGTGELGGKANGLVFARKVLEARFGPEVTGEIDVRIPTTTVISSHVFDLFIERNDLADMASSELPDDRIAHAFQRAEMPVEIVGDLRALIEHVHLPLAVRSSSLLEDALFSPFAGVYETKMTPNNQADQSARFRKLVEAIKFVYASTYFRAAKDYIRATDKTTAEEKMAVIIQEVVGRRHGDRFYPDVSGVGRSYDFYPASGAQRNEGVVNLALGLGKTIVDGGITWSFSPASPAAPPPFGSVGEMLKNTQLEFWAVNMGRPPEYSPVAEKEYLVRCDLPAAEYDDTLAWLASTYDGANDRLIPGTSRPGPRVLTFAPLLCSEAFPLNEVLKKLLSICKEELGMEVETEFALTLPARGSSERARLDFLQVRPMVVSEERVEIADEEMEGQDVLLASSRVMGNGLVETILDVVYVIPESFDSLLTQRIAADLEKLNGCLVDEGRPYLLIGFGRWGSSHPTLGIPVDWGQICGAKAIVEGTLENMNVELSQGSHFFHNITSFEVSYFQVHHKSDPVAWAWLAKQEVIRETELVRHVRLKMPLLVKVDGMTGRGVVRYQD